MRHVSKYLIILFDINEPGKIEVNALMGKLKNIKEVVTNTSVEVHEKEVIEQEITRSSEIEDE